MKSAVRLFLLTIFFWFPVLFSCAQKQNSLDFRPNILWLVAEDLSPVIPPFGDSTVVTPVLSRLAAEGIRFTHVFSPSGVCAPSRAAIATGMYPTHIAANHMRTINAGQYNMPGVVSYEAIPPAGVRMHSEVLRRAGYYASNNSKEDYQFRKTVTAWDESSNKAHWRNRRPGQPFFSIFNFTVTHESRIWRKAGDSLWVDKNLQVSVPPYLPDNEIGRRDVRRMYSNICEMDAQVGETIGELEQDGLLDSTIIFWYADHGGPLPRQKRLLYDSGMRVPMIIRFPNGWRAGEIDDQLVSFIDFKPTVLSLAGIEPPEHLDGRAFLGRYATSPQRQYVHGAADRFDECYDNIRAVRDHRFKYLRNYRTNQGYYLPVSYREQMPIMQELLRMRAADELNSYQALWFRDTKPEEELFDTVDDPHELHNLAGEPAFADKLVDLRSECQRWLQEIDDTGLMPEPELIRSLWPGGLQPETAAPVLREDSGMLSISCETEGASIGYQVVKPGAEPADVWQVYTGAAIRLTDGERLIATAHRLGYLASAVVTFEPQ